jgi:hypothetical protein
MKHLVYSLLAAVVAAGPGINPNPDPNFDPSTSRGTFGTYVPAQQAAPGANARPAAVDARTAQMLQLAMSNWATDTGVVSGFQDAAALVADDDDFADIAAGAFRAEVDELTQKAALDAVVGSDPRVSVANLTLTNGAFQSVVDNLQIMSVQGRSRLSLVDAINAVRCTQILPSIDAYLVVAAEYIGDAAQQQRAMRPDACGDVLARAPSSAFPNLPVSSLDPRKGECACSDRLQGTPAGNPPGRGDGNISGVPGAGMPGAGSLPPYSGSVSLAAAPNGTFAETNSTAGASNETLASSSASSPSPSAPTPPGSAAGNGLAASGNLTALPSSANLGDSRTGNFTSFPAGNFAGSATNGTASGTGGDGDDVTPGLGLSGPDDAPGSSSASPDGGTDAGLAAAVPDVVLRRDGGGQTPQHRRFPAF